MTILPRVLYLFQTLPISIPLTYFKNLNSVLFKFIWRNRPARIKRKLLFLPRERGGLAVPNCKLYWIAAQLQRICDWSIQPGVKRWVDLEASFSERVPLREAPWVEGRPGLSGVIHPTITPTLSVFTRYRNRRDISPWPTPLLPLIDNPDFPLGMHRPNIGAWGTLTQVRAADVIVDGQWVSLDKLRKEKNQAGLDPWILLLFQQYLSLRGTRVQLGRSLTNFERLCRRGLPTPHLLSGIYKVLMQEEEAGGDFWGEWEKDLGTPLAETQRKKITDLVHKTSIASKTQEMGYKILSRWYLTPQRLHSIFPNTSPMCWRCLTGVGSMFHIFWQCPKIRTYWKSVRQTIVEATSLEVPDSPGLFLLHSTEAGTSKYKRSLLAHLINAAKAVIPRNWKKPRAPGLKEWFAEVNLIKDMEDLTASLRDKDSQFRSTWTAWIQFQSSEKYKSIMASD